MLVKTHAATALLAGLIFEPSGLSSAYRFLYYMIVTTATLLPDLDHPGSTLGREFPWISRLFSALFGHRGFSHAIFIPIGLWWMATRFLASFVGWAILVGMLTHLFCDGMTKNGINILHPFAELRIRGFMRTGGIFESVFLTIVLAGIALKIF